MSETSTMLPLGTKAPAFNLLDSRINEYISLQDLQSEIATVVMFLCNHCPYVQHILDKLVEVTTIYQSKGINFVAINSNDVEAYPEDGPEGMAQIAERYNFTFPYLYDETQSVAKAYQAACTPDFFVFDKNLACVYRGQFDPSTPKNQIAVTGIALRAALDAILTNQPVNPTQQPSIGCSIKWRR